MRSKLATFFAVTLMSVCCAPASLGQSPVPTEFISLESAQPVLKGMADELPPDLKAVGTLDASKWSAWVQRQDREVRDRLVRGEEDTLVNLLRFGVTYTKEYRIDDEFLAHYGKSSLVNSFAENRADDLIRAWMAPNPPEGSETQAAPLPDRLRLSKCSLQSSLCHQDELGPDYMTALSPA
jgi:hypothetical protein